MLIVVKSKSEFNNIAGELHVFSVESNDWIVHEDSNSTEIVLYTNSVKPIRLSFNCTYAREFIICLSSGKLYINVEEYQVKKMKVLKILNEINWS